MGSIQAPGLLHICDGVFEVDSIVSNKALKVSLLIGSGVVLLIAVMSIASLDFVRWLNCNSPFTPLQDKNSDVCRRLKSAP